MQKIHPEILHRFGRDPKIIFERDGWKCLECGSKEDLTIDHIDGNGRNSKHPNNNLENLQTLCRKCHGRKDQKRRYDRSHRIKKYCLQCQKIFETWECMVKSGKGKFCKKECYWEYQRG